MTISLAFLAPSLVMAAVEGRLPHGVGVTRLFDPPVAWSRQHQIRIIGWLLANPVSGPPACCCHPGIGVAKRRRAGAWSRQLRMLDSELTLTCSNNHLVVSLSPASPTTQSRAKPLSCGCWNSL